MGDNEHRESLFTFHLQDGLDSFGQQGILPLKYRGGREVSDIEGIARLSKDTILVLGSHSRNTRCEQKGKRRSFSTFRISRQEATPNALVKTKEITCKGLFEGDPPQGSVLDAVCKEISKAEKQADILEEKVENGTLSEERAKQQCNEILPFNAEGIVAIPGSDGAEVWIGLRAPLLPQHPAAPERRDLAILLHMINPKAFKFDRVALLDLGGRGIRELAFAEDKVWVIAGPAADKADPFELRNFSVNELEVNRIVNTRVVLSLPTSSEGLAIKNGMAYVVIDGDVGPDDSAKRCKQSSRLLVLRLPGEN